MPDDPSPGEPVYTADGELVGHIEIAGEGELRVVSADDEGPTAHAGRGYGEADLVWRCGECGEIGDISSMPDACPNCDAGREELYYLTQD